MLRDRELDKDLNYYKIYVLLHFRLNEIGLLRLKDDYDFDVKKERPEERYENVMDYFMGETLSKYATSKSMMKIKKKLQLELLSYWI